MEYLDQFLDNHDELVTVDADGVAVCRIKWCDSIARWKVTREKDDYKYEGKFEYRSTTYTDIKDAIDSFIYNNRRVGGRRPVAFDFNYSSALLYVYTDDKNKGDLFHCSSTNCFEKVPDKHLVELNTIYLYIYRDLLCRRCIEDGLLELYDLWQELGPLLSTEREFVLTTRREPLPTTQMECDYVVDMIENLKI